MPISHTQTQGFRSNNGSFTVPTLTQTVEAEFVVDVTVPVSTTDKEYSFTADVSEMGTFFMLATGGAVTLKTNNSGTPVQTFAMDAGDAYNWFSTGSGTNPLTTDVTKIYATNASAT